MSAYDDVLVTLSEFKTLSAHITALDCKQATGTKKPEWQILAERNGWSPK
jgi:hypothetical protein